MSLPLTFNGLNQLNGSAMSNLTSNVHPALGRPHPPFPCLIRLQTETREVAERLASKFTSPASNGLGHQTRLKQRPSPDSRPSGWFKQTSQARPKAHPNLSTFFQRSPRLTPWEIGQGFERNMLVLCCNPTFGLKQMHSIQNRLVSVWVFFWNLTFG